jgi:hypothetical protein
MAVIVKPFSFSAGATVIAAEHNSNFDTIFTEFNGGIDNANIKASAAIAGSKLGTLGTITSASGIIPAVNISLATSYPASTGTGVICSATATSANSVGWALLRFVGGGTGFVPYWTGITT